jgi:hypothetical protein
MIRLEWLRLSTETLDLHWTTLMWLQLLPYRFTDSIRLRPCELRLAELACVIRFYSATSSRFIQYFTKSVSRNFTAFSPPHRRACASAVGSPQHSQGRAQHHFQCPSQRSRSRLLKMLCEVCQRMFDHPAFADHATESGHEPSLPLRSKTPLRGSEKAMSTSPFH